MRSFIRWILAAMLPAFVPAPPAHSALDGREIRPPFGLNWGLGYQQVEESVQAAGGHVVERQPTGVGEERWSVEGIAQEGLQRALFTFCSGHLAGVELQYGKEEWDAQTYDEFMRRVRASLDAEHGTGRMLVRQRMPSAGVLKTMVGYSWAGGPQSVSLIYFAAQDERNLFRLVSLHYSARPARTYPQTVKRS
jgi:hypothetical protein